MSRSSRFYISTHGWLPHWLCRSSITRKKNGIFPISTICFVVWACNANMCGRLFIFSQFDGSTSWYWYALIEKFSTVIDLWCQLNCGNVAERFKLNSEPLPSCKQNRHPRPISCHNTARNIPHQFRNDLCSSSSYLLPRQINVMDFFFIWNVRVQMRFYFSLSISACLRALFTMR